MILINLDDLNDGNNQSEQLPQLRLLSYDEESDGPKIVGHMRLYFRESVRTGGRSSSHRLYVPVARYNRRHFPFEGPFISLMPRIPIFSNRRDKQTIINTKHGLKGPEIPKIDPSTNRFMGNIRINYGSFSIPRQSETVIEHISDYKEDDDNDSDDYEEKEERNTYRESPNRYKSRQKPRTHYRPTSKRSRSSVKYPTTTKPTETTTKRPLNRKEFDISRYWGNLSPYRPSNGFGVKYNEIPSDCTTSQVHILHRHGQRFPSGTFDDGGNTQRFADRVTNASRYGKLRATGSLSFLNKYEYKLGLDLLTAIGSTTAFTSGSNFWTQYGRFLYENMSNSTQWNDSLNVFADGSPRRKPFIRTTSQARIYESARWWASGFFNNPDGGSSNTSYDLLIIPEGGTENNTLASYDSCTNYNDPTIVFIGDTAQAVFYNNYLKDAVGRFSTHLNSDFNLTAMDVYAMQTICPYEVAYFGSSDFCSLFTDQEWIDFGYSLSIQFYGDYSFGNPTGRAQGIGYVQELLARLQNRYIDISESSVNSTLDNNPTTFPLGQPFYLDYSHDDIIVSVLTALGMEYFKGPSTGLPYDIPHAPNPPENFDLSQMTPFGARLFTEVLTCSSSNPKVKKTKSTVYSKPNITNGTKFIRMQLNEKTLPLHTIGCPVRSDGLCSLEDFLVATAKTNEEAQYAAACFGDYAAKKLITSQVSN
ncbi:unnamed protein product, partial [Adineta steineri]